MEKYRIRLANGRVVGPFNKEQITELYAKGHIEGTEECQHFPAGEWLKVLDFETLSDIFRQNLNQSTYENATVLKKLSELNLDKPKSITSDDKKINQTEAVTTQNKISTKSLDEEDPNFPKEFSYKNLINKDPSRVNIQTPDLNKVEISKPVVKDDGPKTMVRKAPTVEDNADKTIVNPSTKEYLEKLKKEKELADLDAKKKEESRIRKMSEKTLEPEEEVFDPNQATQMFSIAKVKENLHKEAQHAEQELELIKREIEIKKSREQKIQEEEETKGKSSVKVTKKEEKPKKGMKPIIAVVFLGIILYFMFPDQEENKRPAYAIDVFTAKIDFPAPFKQENAEQSKADFERAQELYKKGDMTSIYQASLAYKSSLEHKFNGNESLGRLILTYAELLADVKKDRDAGNEIFKLIQIAKTKGINDIYITMGTAIFYDHFKKYHAAIKTIEDYLLVNKQKSQKLVAIYIKVLVNSGNLAKAKATIDKVMNAPDKNADMYQAIASFYLANNEHKEALKWVDEGLSKFANNMPLIITKSDIIVYNEDFKGLSEQVKKIKSLEAEHSMRYYAKYLEYFGLLSAVAKKKDEALIFFKEALKIKQSPELISKLASLEATTAEGDKVAELIAMSKSIDYMNKAKEAMRRKNWESAFSFSIEATDIAPKYYPAKLLLASIQVKQGYFNQAIETLSKLQQEYPNEGEISFALVEAYTQSFKFKDALRLLDSLAATAFKNTPEYVSALGRFYAKKSDFFQAVTWLQKSININPIFDEDYYILAQTYLKNRSYAKAKVILTKAMELDPTNVDYKVAYSKIIYEMDDAETAIGFLRSALNQTPNDPTLMSEIAIYYYRSGQTKYFEEYKKQLEEMPDRNRNLYQFLIRAAEMDDKPENMVKFAKELIAIEPGDLETRMLLATTLSENKKFEEALEQLNFIEERLPTYPKLLYLRSKILLDMGKKDEAIAVAKKEIEANPQSEEGNILLGNIYVNLTDYLQAENHFKNAQKINAKSTEALVGLAWISFQRNNIETALDLYNKVTKLDPNNSYAHKQLGLVYKLMGQGALAIESFKVYLELEPDAKDREKIKGYIQELQ